MAAECLDFDPTASLGPKEARRLDRSTQFALASAREAWDDSVIEEGADRDEIAVFATGIGGISSLLASDEVMRTKGPNRVSPFTVPQLMPNAAAGQIAMKLGLRGPNFYHYLDRLRGLQPRHRPGLPGRPPRRGHRQ